MNHLDLSGKLILITGGCGAIGRVVVAALTEQGARVAVNDVIPAADAALILQEAGATGDRVAYFHADATDPDGVDALPLTPRVA